MVTIAVRTAFDCWLRVKQFPKGSEISTASPPIFLCADNLTGIFIPGYRFPLIYKQITVMTAINIPDMVKVIREHGLVPVPVDIDPHTLAPTAAAVEALVSPRTVALLVSHSLCILRLLRRLRLLFPLLLLHMIIESK